MRPIKDSYEHNNNNASYEGSEAKQKNQVLENSYWIKNFSFIKWS